MAPGRGPDGLGATRYPASAMGRPLRIDMSNGLYHVTGRGLERGAIVYENPGREHWLELLDREGRLAARIGRCGRAIEQMSRVKT